MPEVSHAAHPAPHTVYVPPSRVLDQRVANVCLFLFLVTLWPLTHRYKGITGDAELYAVQALAKIHPNLAGDLFLQNNSQDNYTVFPWLYSWFIRWLGLPVAALTFVAALKIWFFAATWALSRELFDRRSAFLSTAMVMVIAGSYGGYSVFKFSEDWLTARTLAEPMVLTAIWVYFRNFKATAFLVALAAMFVHPLMTFPVVTLLFILWLPLSIGAAGAAFCAAAALGTALLALHQPPDLSPFSIMDSDWLSIVRERSVFLFPQLWPAKDWELNALPFASLAISFVILRDRRIQKLSIAAALVGATGLLIALIAATVGPVALFLQSQAWRWVWITRFTALILLAPTLLKMWRQDKCGPSCVVLTVMGWTVPPAIGLACLTMSLVFWSARHHVTRCGATYFSWAAIALGGAALAWVIAQSWPIAPSAAPFSDTNLVIVFTRLRNLLGFGVISMSLAWSLMQWLKEKTAPSALSAPLSLLLLICCALLYSDVFRAPVLEGSNQQIAAFSDWRRLIGPEDNVFVVPAHNSAAFAWLTLERPSYLTVGQSAGVVFSRTTALEVRRRSEVLLPLMDPDWKLLSTEAAARSEGGALGQDSCQGIHPRQFDRNLQRPQIEICRRPRRPRIRSDSSHSC